MKTKKQLNILTAIYYIILIVLISCIINPIYSSLATDVLTRGTLTVLAVDILRIFLQFLLYTLTLSAIVYSNFLSPNKKNSEILIISLLGVCAKYIVNLIFDIISIGKINSLQIISIVIYIAIDAAQIFVVYFVSRKLIRRWIFIEKKKRNSSSSLGIEYEECELLPFKSVFEKKNALMLSAGLASAAIAVPKIFSRLTTDIFDIIMGKIDSVEDIIWMIIYYSMDVLSFFAGYLIIIFVFTLYFDGFKKKNKDPQNQD